MEDDRKQSTEPGPVALLLTSARQRSRTPWALSNKTAPERKKDTMTIPPDDNHEHDELLSIEEAAAFLRVPVKTMRYWR